MKLEVENVVLMALLMAEGKPVTEQAAAICKALEKCQLVPPAVVDGKLPAPPSMSWAEPVPEAPPPAAAVEKITLGGENPEQAALVVTASEADLDAELSLRRQLKPAAALTAGTDGPGANAYYSVADLARLAEQNLAPNFTVLSGNTPVAFNRVLIPLAEAGMVRVQYRCAVPPAGLKTMQAACSRSVGKQPDGQDKYETFTPSTPLQVQDALSIYDEDQDYAGVLKGLQAQAADLVRERSGIIRTVPVPSVPWSIETGVGVKLPADEFGM